MPSVSESSVSIILFILSLFSSSAIAHLTPPDAAVSAVCGRTMYPALCRETLAGSKMESNQYVDSVTTLLRKAIHETTLPSNYFNSTTGATLQAGGALHDWCDELTKMSWGRLNQALAAVEGSPEGNKLDIQTWLSAAITFYDTCRDEVETYGMPTPFKAKIHEKMEYLSQLVSNALAIVNSNIPEKDSPAGDRVHGGGFPGWVSPASRKLLAGTGVDANAVVAKDGSGHFTTVSDAIRAASGGRFVIYVKAGVYNEKIVCKKDGITLIGDGKYSTIISGGSSVGGGSSLLATATFTIMGDGFIAKDIGFENTAGPEKHQAIALTVASDRSVFYRCSIIGHQDTLFAMSLRQFYRECDIGGTVDYVFGNAAAVMQSCSFILRRPRVGGAFVTILASGRSDPGQNTGFCVHNSKIVVGSDFAPVQSKYDSYLGRPWRSYARSVVMKTDIDAEIAERGWVEWEGSRHSTYSTLYYGEFANTGAGAGTSGRVTWPGFHVMGMLEASKFTVGAFIGGNSWLPSTGVDFLADL